MWTNILLIIGFISLLGGVIFFASKSGSKSAQLDSLKAEIKKRAEEHARAQKILNNVSNMSSDDIRKRLQDVSGK